ncbi:pyridine nucleotide-disulfide oxidoreductase family protein, partial [Vibrio cholerae CP1035(8)]
PTF